MHVSRRHFSAFLSAIGVLALFVLPAVSHAIIPFVPKADVYVGYSRLGSDAFYSDTSGLNGWQGALNVKVMPFVGIEGDVSQFGLGTSSDKVRTTTYLFGPRVTVGALGVRVFAHGLVGGEHSSSSGNASVDGSSYTYALGGGVDLPLVPLFSWRITGDYLEAPNLTTENGNHYRFGTGLVFRF